MVAVELLQHCGSSLMLLPGVAGCAARLNAAAAAGNAAVIHTCVRNLHLQLHLRRLVRLLLLLLPPAALFAAACSTSSTWTAAIRIPM
jgi:hypothetical protein